MSRTSPYASVSSDQLEERYRDLFPVYSAIMAAREAHSYTDLAKSAKFSSYANLYAEGWTAGKVQTRVMYNEGLAEVAAHKETAAPVPPPWREHYRVTQAAYRIVMEGKSPAFPVPPTVFPEPKK